MSINFLKTVKGSKLEGFYPAGWDFDKLHECCSHKAEEVTERQSFWHDDFEVFALDSTEDYMVRMGHDMAIEVKKAKEGNYKLAFILPIGPVGQYKWCAYFLKQWKIKCDHVYGFNMDDWADAEGNITETFGPLMQYYFYDELGEYTIPEDQRNYATKENLPTYEEKLAKIQADGGKVVLVHGIGRDLHVAFSEPHWAADHDSLESYKKESYRIAGKLHPLTIEQNSTLSFRSNFLAATTRGNTICMGLMMKSDYAIGGCAGIREDNDGTAPSWQNIGLWASLRYGPNMWVPCSFLPTIPGRFYFPRSLAEMGN